MQFGMNVFHCCRRYGAAVEDLCVVTPAYIFKVIEAGRDVSQVCTVRSILELVFIRAGDFVFSDMRHSAGLSA